MELPAPLPVDQPTRLSCPSCGKVVSASASEALCTACLLAAALAWTELLPEESEAAPPPTISGYDLLEEIGRGGMGVVYRAREAGLPREVALKMLSSHDFASPDQLRRFRLEAAVIAQLNHPNIVTLHRVGEDAGRPFFVMKLAEGGTLAHRPGKVAPREAAALTGLLARAVHYAHGLGVLHRDLKPGNILLEVDGTPLVSDFGLARLAEGPAGTTLTGSALGTPAYMAPEQILGAEAVTTAADVYGLGAILYFMLTGRAPFAGATPMEIMQRVMQDEPEPPQRFVASLDRDLATICLKCLEKSPHLRYRSAAALADDLDRWAAGEPVLARRAGGAERVWKWSRRHPAKATLIGSAGLGLLIFTLALAEGNRLLRHERNFAQEQERLAQAEALRAHNLSEKMRFNVYASDVLLASRALEDGHLGSARSTLARHQPGVEEPNLCGFEWHALRRLCAGDDLLVLTQQRSAIQTIAYSPDGKTVAAGTRDGQLRILDAQNGRMIQSMPAAKTSALNDFLELANLPLQSAETEALLAQGSTLENVRTRAKTSNLGDIRTLVWSPDGAVLATGGNSCYVRLWNTSTWSMLGFIPVNQASQLAFTKDSQQLVIAVGTMAKPHANRVLRYEVKTLRRMETIERTAPFFALASAADCLGYVQDGQVVVRQLSDKKQRQWAADHGVYGMALSPDGGRIALLASTGGTLRNSADGHVLAGFSTGTAPLYTAAFSPAGEQLAVAGAGQVIHTFHGTSGKPQALLRGHDAAILALAYAPQTDALISSGNDHTARLWHIKQQAADAEIVLELSADLEAISADGTKVAGTVPDGRTFCYDWKSQEMKRLPGDFSRRALAFDTSLFVTIRKRTGILEWWHPDGQPDGSPITLAADAEMLIAVCAKAKWIIASKPKGPLVCYDWRSGKVLQTLPPPPLNAFRLEASPDGRFLCASEYPRSSAVLDLASGRWLWMEKMTSGTTGPILFSPDGNVLVSSGDDEILTVREALTGKVTATLRGHFSEVKALAFSLDGRTLASSSDDKTLRLWNVPTWRELGVLRHGPLIGRLLFAPQGLLLAEYQQRWRLMRGE